MLPNDIARGACGHGAPAPLESLEIRTEFFLKVGEVCPSAAEMTHCVGVFGEYRSSLGMEGRGSGRRRRAKERNR
jgi:hypothetical protein